MLAKLRGTERRCRVVVAYGLISEAFFSTRPAKAVEPARVGPSPLLCRCADPRASGRTPKGGDGDAHGRGLRHLADCPRSSLESADIEAGSSTMCLRNALRALMVAASGRDRDGRWLASRACRRRDRCRQDSTKRNGDRLLAPGAGGAQPLRELAPVPGAWFGTGRRNQAGVRAISAAYGTAAGTDRRHRSLRKVA